MNEVDEELEKINQNSLNADTLSAWNSNFNLNASMMNGSSINEEMSNVELEDEKAI